MFKNVFSRDMKSHIYIKQILNVLAPMPQLFLHLVGIGGAVTLLSKVNNNILFPFLQTPSAHKTTSSLCWKVEYNSWMQTQGKLE